MYIAILATLPPQEKFTLICMEMKHIIISQNRIQKKIQYIKRQIHMFYASKFKTCVPHLLEVKLSLKTSLNATEKIRK